MPRKSTASAAVPGSPTANNTGDTSTLSAAPEPKSPAKPSRQSTSNKNDDSIGIDDLLLPRSLISRLARGVLPANTSIQKDAILALTKSATVFISYLASHANEQTSKKTIGPQDVLNALKEIELAQVMGLGQVAEDGRLGGRLERELEMFETTISAKRKGYRDKVKARESQGGPDGAGEGESAVAGDVSGLGGDGGGDEDERGEPSTKRARRMSDDDRMLDAQLNGEGGVTSSGEARTGVKGSGSRMNGTHQGPASGNDEPNDETEDDPEIEDEDEVEDDPNDDDQDEEDLDEDEEELPDEDKLEMGDNDDSRLSTNQRSRLELAPNGRIEVGSEDESD